METAEKITSGIVSILVAIAIVAVVANMSGINRQTKEADRCMKDAQAVSGLVSIQTTTEMMNKCLDKIK